MKKTPKDIWIDKVMDSTEGMDRAAPPDTLFHKIEQKVVSAHTVPFRTVSLAAASIVLLVAVNVFMLGNTAKQTKVTAQSEVETVVEYYGLNENTINY